MAQIKSVDDAMLFHEFKCFMNEELDIPEHEILTRPAFSTKPFEDVEEDFLLDVPQDQRPAVVRPSKK